MDIFERMGRTVAQRWRARHHDRGTFAELAVEALRDERPHESVTTEALVRWVFEQDTLPLQADPQSRFGQPAITLFHDDHFSISALFWLDGTTTIHQHAFSGAFAVLAGSSVHAHYEFERRDSVSEAVVRGHLTAGHVEHLQRGDARAIHAGPKFIHALFHLDRPSVSLVIRTHADGHAGPQYSYSRSGLGVDGHFEPPTLTKQLQALMMLLKTGAPEAGAVVRAWMARADAHSAFRLLTLLDTRARVDLFTEALAILEKRDASLSTSIGDAILREREEREIVSFRSDIADPELRYFLALLLNVESRSQILQLISSRFPEGDVHARVDRWLDALVSIVVERGRKEGTSSSGESNAAFVIASLGSRERWALGRFVRGDSDEAIAASALRGEAPAGASFSASEIAKLRFVLSFTSLLRPLLNA